MYIKSNKRKLQANKTRRHIYETASRLFALKSFDEVTVEEIAVAAGVSVGAFYHHFKNKQEILAIFYKALDDEYSNYYESMLAESGYGDKNAVVRLEDYLLHTVELIARQGMDFLRVIYPYMLCDMEFGDSVASRNRYFFSILREIIEDGKNNGEITGEVATEKIIDDITIMCRGCEVDWCINRGSDTIREHSINLIKTYLNGLKPGRTTTNQATSQ